MATEQSEALGHLLSVRRVSDSSVYVPFFASVYAPVAQQDTPPAGGVQMATEQSEALGHLLSVRRVSDSSVYVLFFESIYAPVAQQDRASAS